MHATHHERHGQPRLGQQVGEALARVRRSAALARRQLLASLLQRVEHHRQFGEYLLHPLAHLRLEPLPLLCLAGGVQVQAQHPDRHRQGAAAQGPAPALGGAGAGQRAAVQAPGRRRAAPAQLRRQGFWRWQWLPRQRWHFADPAQLAGAGAQLLQGLGHQGLHAALGGALAHQQLLVQQAQVDLPRGGHRQGVGRRVQAGELQPGLLQQPPQGLQAFPGQPAQRHLALCIAGAVGHMHLFTGAENQRLRSAGHRGLIRAAGNCGNGICVSRLSSGCRKHSTAGGLSPLPGNPSWPRAQQPVSVTRPPRSSLA